VRRVVVRYRLPGRQTSRKQVTLLDVSDPAALRATGIRDPFGYFVGAVPHQAREVSAEAHDDRGAVLDRFKFDKLAAGNHPTVFIAIKG